MSFKHQRVLLAKNCTLIHFLQQATSRMDSGSRQCLVLDLSLVRHHLLYAEQQKILFINSILGCWGRVGTFVCIITLACCENVRRSSPQNFIFLGIFVCVINSEKLHPHTCIKSSILFFRLCWNLGFLEQFPGKDDRKLHCEQD